MKRLLQYKSYIKEMQYMQEDFQDNILCIICSDIILTPARLNCGHEFCCYCIRSIMYKLKQDNMIICPLCRSEEIATGLDKKKEIQVINYIFFNKKDIRVLYGTAKTINHYDKNLTVSKPFYFLLEKGKLHGDIIWGTGTVHSTYQQEVCRVSGEIEELQDKSLLFKSIKCHYSNQPYQDWKGLLRFKGNGQFQSEKAIYQWHGWNERQTHGDLEITARQLKHQQSLKEQGIEL